MAVDARFGWPGWETVEEIGRGGFGNVYQIRRNLFGNEEQAALKVISIPKHDSEITERYNNDYTRENIAQIYADHMKRLINEYSLVQKLGSCSNIVSCHDVRYEQHADGIGWDIFIKMELLTPLTNAVPTVCSEETAIKIAMDLCNALEVCRQHGVVHRDIKPQNIFVSENGDYKLGDFGVARTMDATTDATKIGTYNYMAPEVATGLKYDARVDIYSLGLVLYWLLNERRLPFLPLPPASILNQDEERAKSRRFSGEPLPTPAHGSTRLHNIVLKACAYHPAARYQTAAQMKADLESLLHSDTDATLPIIPGDSTVRVRPTPVHIDQTLKPNRPPEKHNVVQPGLEDISLIDKVKHADRSSPPRKPRKYCPACGAEMAIHAQHCSACGWGQSAPSAPPEDSHMKPARIVLLVCIILISLGLLAVIIVLLTNQCLILGHDWSTPTCTSRSYCTRCDEPGEGRTDHNYAPATCTSPEQCLTCGETRGTTLSHDWSAPTCTDPGICAYCKATQGSPLGHNWTGGTCTDPATCTRCSISGSTTDHNWEEKGYSNIFVCSICAKSQVPASFEAEAQVSDIREQYNAIQQDIADGKLTETQLDSNTKVYTDSYGNVRKIQITKGTYGAGEYSKYEREYYYYQNKLIFAFYDISTGDSHRLYFYQGCLFRWRHTENDIATNYDLVFQGESQRLEQVVLTESNALMKQAS